MTYRVETALKQLVTALKDLEQNKLIESLNLCRKKLHEISPFKNEPVDFIEWVKSEEVFANDYNPNSVAPPEMELLKVSILQDGYTQPIVTFEEEQKFQVVDGFHRNRVGKECKEVNERILNFLPVVRINEWRKDRTDRIASTIRHNRARGKHGISAMSDIVIELKKRNWSNDRIGKELGMDTDEILRLCQITGLTEVFSDENFSQAWDVKIFSAEELGNIDESEFEESVEDENRIYHTWDKWECYPAGFYKDVAPNGMATEEAENAYREFLKNIPLFESILERVLEEWVNSCEHYLSNERMNRIAWLGQAAMCLYSGIPSRFRGGYNLLTDEEKQLADNKALEFLNKWLVKYNRAPITFEEAQSQTQMDLY